MAKQTAQADELQNLKASIRSGKIGRLYFFKGEETFLLHHYLDQIHKKLLSELTEEFNFHRFTQETFSMQEFADSVENLPMMAEHSLVQVDDVDIFKLPEDQREKLAEVLLDIPDYCTVVFLFETVAWKPDKRMKALYEAVSKGTVVEFAKQGQRELTAWVIRHFAEYQKHISQNLCIYLIEITGGTMTALGGEIRKIAAYAVSDEIQKSDIDAVTEPVLDAVVFQMTDLLSEGNYGAALDKLQKLFMMQEEPISILGAVGASLRRISAARTLMDQGKGADALMNVYDLRDYAARKTMAAAKRVTPDFCRKAAELVLETDYKMKTSFDTSERLLELLILQLAQEASRG